LKKYNSTEKEEYFKILKKISSTFKKNKLLSLGNSEGCGQLGI
jgi:hypothetical protein